MSKLVPMLKFRKPLNNGVVDGCSVNNSGKRLREVNLEDITAWVFGQLASELPPDLFCGPAHRYSELQGS